MKSAEEWTMEAFSGEHSKRMQSEIIEMIQADALYHAAEYVGQMPKKYNRLRAWDAPYRAACVFARSHLRQMAADLTRSLS